MPEWTTLKRMIWLLLLRGASAVIRTVTGTAPLELENAIAAAIHSLTQYGKCTQASTPTPDAPVDIVCNNGALKYGVLGKNWFGLNESPAERTYLDSTGSTGTSANWTLSEFIAVNPATQYTFNPNSTSGATAKIGYYTADQTFISAIDSGLQTFTTPNNCFFMRFSYRNESTNIQLEVGSTATAFEPYKGRGVIADGTPEVLTVGGKNLVNITSADIEQGAISSSDGANAGSASHRVRTIGYYPVKPNTQYTISCVIDGYISGSSKGVFLLEYSSDSVSGYTGDTSGWKSPDGYTFTTGATTNFIRIVFAKGSSTSTPTTPEDVSNIQLEYGDTATDYQPYVTPQTVTDIPMLLGVGGYADEAEIISGIKTGKVGIKVLNGTETIGTSNATYTIGISDRIASKVPVICSHFPYSNKTSSQTDDGTIITFSSTNIGFRYDTCATKEAFKEWLAAQYAAGTPVIVLYPLATETTEQGTAHALHTSAGTNVVDVESNVDPVELEIEYSASV